MTDTGGNTTSTTISMTEQDSLPDVLEQIRAARGSSVSLEIPEHSPVFLTATEFRTLRDAADSYDVTVQLVTEDPLRLQLASMFGLADSLRPRDREADAETDREIEATPSFRGWRSARARHTGAETDDNEEDAADPIAISRRRRTEAYEAGKKPPRAVESPNVGLSEDASYVSLSYLEEDAGANTAQKIGRIVAVVLVAALIAFVAGWYYMPGVTVTAQLRQAPISTELIYSVTAPGAAAAPDAAFSVEATELSDTVAFSFEVPVTGLQSTPDQTATGSVTLRNASDAAVTIPAGTALTTAAGVAYTTDAEVEVPAGSTDGSTIGEATVAVTASEPGASSNVGPGELSGKVADQPVFFSNLDAEITNGSDIEVGVVTQADLDTVDQLMASDVNRIVAEAWTEHLPEGQAMLIPSVDAEDPDYTVQQQVGDQADHVVVDGTADATGFRYDENVVEQRAQEFYASALQEEVPDGYELLTDTVTLGEANLVAQSTSSVEFRMEATATIQAVFSDGDRDRVIADMAGSDEESAEIILGNEPALASWEIAESPGWWPGGMPRAESRISIETTGGTDTEPAATPASADNAS